MACFDGVDEIPDNSAKAITFLVEIDKQAARITDRDSNGNKYFKFQIEVWRREITSFSTSNCHERTIQLT